METQNGGRKILPLGGGRFQNSQHPFSKPGDHADPWTLSVLPRPQTYVDDLVSCWTAPPSHVAEHRFLGIRRTLDSKQVTELQLAAGHSAHTRKPGYVLRTATTTHHGPSLAPCENIWVSKSSHLCPSDKDGRPWVRGSRRGCPFSPPPWKIPLVVEMSLSACGCRKFQIDPLGDHLCTCTTHSGAKKDHDWSVDQIADLFHTTHKVKTEQVARSRGHRCGDIELAGYLVNAEGPVPLVLDQHITHERWGSRIWGSTSDPSINGHLHYPNDLDRSLNEAASDKIRSYRARLTIIIVPLTLSPLYLLRYPTGLWARPVIRLK